MKNLKIKSKLMVLVTTILVLLLFMGGLAVVMIRRVNNSTTIMADVWVPGLTIAGDINTNTSNFRIQEYRHVLATNLDEVAEADKELKAIKESVDQSIAEYEPIAVDDNDRKMIAGIKSAWEDYLKVHEKILAASLAYDQAGAMALLESESLVLFNELDSQCKDIVALNKAGTVDISDQGDKTLAASLLSMILFGAAALLVSILLTVKIVRAVTIPLNEISMAARNLSQGKLDAALTYESHDEIGLLSQDMRNTMKTLSTIITDLRNVMERMAEGDFTVQSHCEKDYVGAFLPILQSFKKMKGSISSTMGQINESADQVASGSDQVSSGAQALSQGATEQASSVEELAATINDISNQVKDTAENAMEARKQSMNSGEEITVCSQQMQDMQNAMDEISHKSTEIGKIIKTIEDIAFQTNILALNAAVEAARAGAAGKGFAVVADEVRNLASKSAEASKNTSDLIEGSITAVEKGTKIASETANSLLRVVESAQLTSDTVDKIADAAREQATSIAQVTQGIDQISSVVQTNSATAEESAAASEELSGQAQMLKNLISRFKLENSNANMSYEASDSQDKHTASAYDASYQKEMEDIAGYPTGGTGYNMDVNGKY